MEIRDVNPNHHCRPSKATFEAGNVLLNIPSVVFLSNPSNIIFLLTRNGENKPNAETFLSWLNNLSTVGKVLALIIIIICGIVNLFKGYTEHLQQGFEPIENDFKMSVGECFLV